MARQRVGWEWNAILEEVEEEEEIEEEEEVGGRSIES